MNHTKLLLSFLILLFSTLITHCSHDQHAYVAGHRILKLDRAISIQNCWELMSSHCCQKTLTKWIIAIIQDKVIEENPTYQELSPLGSFVSKNITVDSSQIKHRHSSYIIKETARIQRDSLLVPPGLLPRKPFDPFDPSNYTSYFQNGVIRNHNAKK